VRTIVSDPPPADFEAFMERRRRWGGDRRDEVWQGVLHMNQLPHGRHAKVQAQVLVLLDPFARAAELMLLAASNLGDPDDFRGPDGMLQGPGPDRLYYPTAALALEVVSPGDETWDKLAFYASHGVDELLIVDPQERTVQWLALDGGGYQPTPQSGLIDLGPSELAERIDWPELTD
jgi:hypothetical protein